MCSSLPIVAYNITYFININIHPLLQENQNEYRSKKKNYPTLHCTTIFYCSMVIDRRELTNGQEATICLLIVCLFICCCVNIVYILTVFILLLLCLFLFEFVYLYVIIFNLHRSGAFLFRTLIAYRCY